MQGRRDGSEEKRRRVTATSQPGEGAPPVCFAILPALREEACLMLQFCWERPLPHAAFVATINCFLHPCPTNTAGCRGADAPACTQRVVSVVLTLNPEDDVRSAGALRKFTRTHFSWR